MTLIPARDLVNTAMKAYEEKWGYIWGKSGQVWTQAQQDKATRDMTVRYGQKWVGRKVADCSGLLVWAFKQHGGSIYHGSNTMWKKYCTSQGSLTGVVKIRPGTAVFMTKDGNRHHVGLYNGDGMCIEAQGTRTGVVLSHLSRWDEWGELVGVDYTGVPFDTIEVGLRTIRKGDSGADVKTAQGLLAAAGYDIGKNEKGEPLIDGIFGSETLSAVRAFQHAHGLDPDGVIGPKTWTALKGTENDDGEDKPAEEPEEIPVAWDAMTLAEKVEDLHQWRLSQMGGESIG